MMNQQAILDPLTAGPQDPELTRWRDLGARLAQSIPQAGSRRHGPRRPNRRRQLGQFLAKAASEARQRDADCVLDNSRLLRSAEKETRDFAARLPRYPSAGETPRVLLLAREYLLHARDEFTAETLIAFLDGYQRIAPLTLKELWGLKPVLQIALLDRLQGARPGEWPAIIESLRGVVNAGWNDFFKSLSVVDRVLTRDPADVYARMDFDSCDRYCEVIGSLAKYSSRSEIEIAETVVSLCHDALARSDGSRAAVRRTHVGFYLVDKGLAQLQAVIGYHPPAHRALRDFILRHPTGFYLATFELLTILLVFAMLVGLEPLTPILAGLLLLILPVSQAALDFVNSLVTVVVRPRALPKFDLSEGIPDHCLTLVAVPALLLNEAQVHDLVLDLEIRFLANRDPNLYFALLSDSPDSDRPVDHRDELVEVCARLVEGLNRQYRSEGRSPFLVLHRHRVYAESEGRWMGWERKRGKLLDLNRLLRGSFDAFPVKVGDTSVLPRVRYVITLDADTQLPRDSAAQLIGAIAHPLNQAVVDPVDHIVVEGYGILQPRIGISIQSASRSRLAALYSGQTGFDIYTRAISDVYQDLFGEGIFTGKGIYEVDVLRQVLEDRFPESTLLSHDLIEGAYARAALASDIELIDDYPSHFSSYSRRKHRWVRGDWQILRWILSRVPDYYGHMMRNPISLISQWKIVDNLRRSLFEPALLLLFLASWLYLPQPAGYWTAAAVAVLFLPTYSRLLFSFAHVPRGRRAVAAWAWDSINSFAEGNAVALFSLIFLLHQSLLSLDAIARSLGRVLVTGRKMLEWETAAEAEASGGSKATVDTYLEWTPAITLAIAAAVWLIRPSAMAAAAPILVLWLASRGVSGWLNRRPRSGKCRLREADAQLLRGSAERIYRFFRDWSSPATHWLIPDNVREDGAAVLKLSPTNLAMLLNARVAAVHLGLAPLAEFVFETSQTLDQVLALPKHRGHLFNWYDIRSLAPIDPLFVSTVDSGNLAASLWALKHAALAFAAEPPSKRGVTRLLAEQLSRIAETCDRLVREMDFRFLYDKGRRAMSIGYHYTQQRREVACYDLLASEARIGVFIAIAKGDVPQSVWFQLGRSHALVRGERVLLSWTGTIFEYLMPTLWMRHYPATITEQSAKAAVRIQRDFARRRGVPWGISESACLGNGAGDPGYEAFGVPDIAIKRMPETVVISPYSSFLALASDPAPAVENLRQLEQYGWTGRYGFYESIEYTRNGGQPIRQWMAHHQGMSLLAITNLLFDNILQQYFHAEPQVLATELLLHERMSVTAYTEPDVLPAPEPLPVAVAEAAT